MKGRLYYIHLLLLLVPGCDLHYFKPDPDPLEKENAIKSIRVSSYAALDSDGIVTRGHANNAMNFKDVFDADGKLLEHTEYMDGSVSITEYSEYDSTGLLRRTRSCSPPDTSCQQTVFQYDDEGRLIKRSEFLPDGTLQSYDIIEHSEGSRMISNCSANDSLLMLIVNEFDESGYLISNVVFGPDEIMRFRNVFTYDEHGNQLTHHFYGPDGILMAHSTYVYNTRNNLIERKNYDKDNLLIENFSFEYQLDEKNNWIIKTEFLDDVPLNYYEREIVYFEIDVSA